MHTSREEKEKACAEANKKLEELAKDQQASSEHVRAYRSNHSPLHFTQYTVLKKQMAQLTEEIQKCDQILGIKISPRAVETKF